MSALRPTAVYVHFPWCEHKCPYCDFASWAAEPTRIPTRDYTDAVRRELAARSGSLPGRSLQSIFVGGGTPSLWPPGELARLLRAIRESFEAVEEPLEITVECNPRSLSESVAAGLAEAGVDRLSVGVQSLREGGLRYLGRVHDGASALHAVRRAARHVEQVSADLIFGWPGLTPSDLVQDAKRLVEAGARHLSTYALTIEPNTRFGELHRRGQLPLASDEEHAAQYAALAEHLPALGLHHYEVSNWAVPGQEARHNQHIWRGGDYLGLGAAAVGCLSEGRGARRHRNEPLPSRYGQRVRSAQPSDSSPASPQAPLPWEAEVEWLTPRQRIQEAWMLGLRTAEGVDTDAIRARIGRDPLAGRRQTLERLASEGRIQWNGTVARVPPAQWLLLDGIVRALF